MLDCEPRVDSYLEDPAATVEFLRRYKPDPRMVVTAGILADRSPVQILDTERGLGQQNICPVQTHSTNLRDRAVIDATGGVWIDNYTDDLTPGLAGLADVIATRMGAD